MTQQLQRRDSEELIPVGSFYDPAQVSRGLMIAMETCHLVSPATSCGEIPEGFAVAFSQTLIDTHPDHGEVYKIKNSEKLGLAKPALDRIAEGIGMAPVPGQSYRLDSGKHPFYCIWQTVVAYQDFSGELKFKPGTKELDFRDGSAQLVGLTTGQIQNKRANIASLAETMSRLRAIRSIGIQTAYMPDQLEKPFVMVRLIRTGHSNDPELAREFKRAQFMAGLDSSKRLFGAPTSVQTFAPAGLIEAPASVAAALEEDDYIANSITPAAPAGGGEGGGYDDGPPADPARNGDRAKAATSAPFGKAKGQPFNKLTTRELRWYETIYERDIEDPDKANFRAKNDATLGYIRDIISGRESGDGRY